MDFQQKCIEDALSVAKGYGYAVNGIIHNPAVERLGEQRYLPGLLEAPCSMKVRMGEAEITKADTFKGFWWSLRRAFLLGEFLADRAFKHKLTDSPEKSAQVDFADLGKKIEAAMRVTYADSIPKDTWLKLSADLDNAILKDYREARRAQMDSKAALKCCLATLFLLGMTIGLEADANK